MSKYKTFKFTNAEANQIRALLNRNTIDGEYYGNYKQYHKRHIRIITELTKYEKSEDYL